MKTKFAATLIAAIINFYVRILFWTCELKVEESKKSKDILADGKLCIASLWHSRILIIPRFVTLRGKKYGAVISASSDGEILASAIKASGHIPIRGSSRKQGTSAMRGVLNAFKNNLSVFITPDGPKGPRYKIQGNISGLAAKYNIPIIPMTYSTTSAKVLGSWDRFIIPKPFGKILVKIGDPINLKKADDAKLEKIMLKQMTDSDNKTGLKVDY